MNKKLTNGENLIFALDIGTRSVIGIVGYMSDGIFHVLYTEREEYKTRAVVDGQIEDISETAKIAVLVKERLEKRIGKSLENVYIAAAGRVLRTIDSEGEIPLPEGKEVDGAVVSSLERSAVQSAYEILAKEQDSDDNYFSVGYAVKKYAIDGYEFSNIIGHKGNVASVSLIVTFLPKEVIDSLYATMNRINLTVSGLTLEPIAAMNAIIPPDLRKLNLALCDIGAGTSDIAVCDKGSVSAYTVATVAGDEITEAVMQACLVDFNTAERVKKEVSRDFDALIQYDNILGVPKEEKGAQIYERIEPTIKSLAELICERILQVNGKVPSAVFLVGGGSQTPGLRTMVAEALKINENMVAVGGNVYIKRMFESSEDILCPDYATPLGIALTAVMQNEADTFSVTINDKRLHLFNIWDNSALGVLQMGGYRYSQIIGRNGKAITYELNGQRKTVYGGLPTPASIEINGKESSLSSVVKPGDIINFNPSKHGKNAEVKLCDVVGHPEAFEVVLDGVNVTVGETVRVNGIEKDMDYSLVGGERITVEAIKTLEDLCRYASFSGKKYELFVNDEKKDTSYILENGDEITVLLKKEEKKPTKIEEKKVIIEKTDRKDLVIQESFEQIINKSEKNEDIYVILNGREIELPPRPDDMGYQFFDLLAFTDIDTKKTNGKIVQLLNGKNASYTQTLRNGDRADIYWSDENK